MEKVMTFIQSKTFLYVTLFLGSFSLLFLGQEFQIGLFVWMAPVFLLLFFRRAKPIQFLVLFLILIPVGFLNQKTHNLFNDPVYGILLGVAFAFGVSINYIVDRILYVKGKGFLFTFIFPVVYVVLEFFFTNLLGSSGVFAISQFSFKPFAALSTITGIHGLSFIICWFASVIYWIFENDFKQKFIKVGGLSFGVVFVLILVFGFVRMNAQVEPTNQVKVATVSGPFDLHELAHEELETLLQLGKNPEMEVPDTFFSNEQDVDLQISNTRKAAEAGAKIIVWNEAALFVKQDQLNKIVNQIGEISKAFEAYILIAFFEESDSSVPKPMNNKSVLFGKDGTIKWEYRKAHPTPAEIPLVNPGDEVLPVLDTEFGRLSSVICYDYDFPSLSKQANEQSVDIMLVPAYDWDGFAALHSKMAQFETLQSGRLLIRANGSGINCVSNNYGEIISELNTFTSSEKIMYADLPLTSNPTCYAQFGNAFNLLCFIASVFLIGYRIFILVKRRKE